MKQLFLLGWPIVPYNSWTEKEREGESHNKLIWISETIWSFLHFRAPSWGHCLQEHGKKNTCLKIMYQIGNIWNNNIIKNKWSQDEQICQWLALSTLIMNQYYLIYTLVQDHPSDNPVTTYSSWTAHDTEMEINTLLMFI